MYGFKKIKQLWRQWRVNKKQTTQPTIKPTPAKCKRKKSKDNLALLKQILKDHEKS